MQPNPVATRSQLFYTAAHFAAFDIATIFFSIPNIFLTGNTSVEAPRYCLKIKSINTFLFHIGLKI